MAQVTKDVRADIDRLLMYLTGEFEWAVSSSESWSLDELESFVAEQPLREEALDDLNAYADLGRLTPEQRRNYDRLVLFMAQHRALLDNILMN